MPKSKRAKVYHLTQVTKKSRDQKDKLFQNIRDAVPEYQHCIVFSVDNMRNSYLKDVRRELSDSRSVATAISTKDPHAALLFGFSPRWKHLRPTIRKCGPSAG